jgi:Phytanoyl-CoA dioxygenase (PhyH)
VGDARRVNPADREAMPKQGISMMQDGGIALVPEEIYTPIINGEPYHDTGANYQRARAENRFLNPGRFISFEAISEQLDDPSRPPLDRADVQEATLTADQLFWRRNGYLVKERFIPESIIDAYLELRQRRGITGGMFENFSPYMRYDEIKDLCLYKPLHGLITNLIGEDLGMHFNLSAFRSTERGWHQDDYLNPPEIVGRYIAVWTAVGDVHPDSGPFEFIPGSHLWGWMRRHLVLECPSSGFLRQRAR